MSMAATLAGRFPVPAVLPGREGELCVRAVAGWHGQDALEDDRHAPAVLRLCGQLRRRLSGIGPAAVPGLPGSGEVIVHGDFGPQNLLLSSDARDVPAVVDWEWCHLGSAVEDLGFIGGSDPVLPAPSGSPLGDALSAVAAAAHAAITGYGFTTADRWPLLGRFGLARHLAPARAG